MVPPRGGGFRGGRGGAGGGRGFGGGRGGGGRGFGGGRGGGRFGGGGGFRDEGPPSEVVEVSKFVHACEGDAVTKLTNEKIPYFNAPIFLENKTQIGKVDEIFGPINESFFSIKMMEGIVANSYSAGDKFFIDPMKLLPLARFLTQPKYVTLFSFSRFFRILTCLVGVYCASMVLLKSRFLFELKARTSSSLLVCYPSHKL
ncbi:Putative H/ACA ribonucleoprotein complex subunit 1-like protein 1 [Linum grandiflorum]